jgi:SAM-dependent methyltransferase
VSWPTHQAPHQARDVAESFGADPVRYDRTRPRYPEDMVRRIVNASPGRRMLDVGCGTGIVARQFQAVGCDVLGVDVDVRMSAVAERSGVAVEVSPFETWDPAGRTFDAVLAGQTWHWIDPVVGAAKAASMLPPGGRIALFWNVHQLPHDLGEAISAVYRRLFPGSVFSRAGTSGLDGYSTILTTAEDGIRQARAFADPERWRFVWEHPYTREEWLDQVPTSGGHSRFRPDELAELLSGIGAAIDAVGGRFTMRYATVVATAARVAG